MAAHSSKTRKKGGVKREDSTTVSLAQFDDTVADEQMQELSLSDFDNEQTAERRGIADSVLFDGAISVGIGLNAVQLGLEVNYPELSTLWLVCENVFVAGFTAEMIVKLVAFRLAYFRDKANWLDALLTCFGILDCWVLGLMPGASRGFFRSMTILRLLRLARIVRVVRLIRRFKQLSLVMHGLANAVSATCWVFLLLMLVVYTCAVFCTEYIGHSQGNLYPGYSEDEVVIDESGMMQNFNPYVFFGSMQKSMLTLFNIAIGGEWSEVVRPLAVKQPLILMLFVGYSVLVAFAVMNVMIAIVVDQVITESRRIDIEIEAQQKAAKKRLLMEIEGLLVKLDTNLDGALDLDELKANYHALDLQQLLHRCDLPAGWSATELWSMLDNDGDGLLEKAEFTTNFFRLMNSNDFQQLCIEQAGINTVKRMVRQSQDILEGQIAETKALLCQIHERQLSGHAHGEEVTELGADGGSVAGTPQRVSSNDSGNDSQGATSPGRVESPACWLSKELPVQPSEVYTQQHGGVAVAPPHNTSHIELDSSAASRANASAVKLDLACNGSRHEVKNMSYKQFTNVLDVALASMREMLCSELIVLTQDQNVPLMSASDEVIRKAAQISPAEADPSPLDLQFGGGVSVAGASLHKSAELGATSVERSSCLCSASTLATAIGSSASGSHAHEGAGRAEQSFIKSAHLNASLVESSPSTCSASQDPAAAIGSKAYGSHANESPFEEAPSPQTLGSSFSEINVRIDPYTCTDITFEHEDKLGFEIHWSLDDLPRVRSVAPSGASYLRGVLEGDQVACCNGVSILGKSRDEVLPLLRQRPLVIRFQRGEFCTAHQDVHEVQELPSPVGLSPGDISPVVLSLSEKSPVGEALRENSPVGSTHKEETTEASEVASPSEPCALAQVDETCQNGKLSLAGQWTCVDTWGLEDFLAASGVSYLERKAASNAPWPRWEFQQSGEKIVFLNHSALGRLREEFTVDGQPHICLDGWKQKVQIIATWEDNALVVHKEGPQGRFREERRIDEDGRLQFTLFPLKDELRHVKWGRSFERRESAPTSPSWSPRRSLSFGSSNSPRRLSRSTSGL